MFIKQRCLYTFSASIVEAVRQVRQNAKAKFDETIDLQLRLNVDPKHGDQMVRGNCVMPGGLGKKIVLAVLAGDNFDEAALRAGADVVGIANILAQIKDGNYKFEKLMATTDALSLLKPFARHLGPKGLMPNAKSGTLVTADQLLAQIKATKAGSIEFRVDSGRNVMVPVGKVSFDEKLIFMNIIAFSNALHDKRPTSIKGISIEYVGSLIKSALVKSTMGKPLEVDVGSIDAKNKDSLLRQYV